LLPCLKFIFNITKIVSKLKKMFWAHPHILRVYEVVSRKPYFLCGLWKMKIFDTKISLFVTRFFLYRPRKFFVLNETLCEHLECEDLHVNIFFYFFDILKFVFWIKEVYAPRIKMVFPMHISVFINKTLFNTPTSLLRTISFLKKIHHHLSRQVMVVS
jgi:hypothetical protein